jgi:hypothetical protein
MGRETTILQEAARILDCKLNQIPGRANELFEKWKKVTKKGKIDSEDDFKLLSKLESNETEPMILKNTASLLKTQPEHIGKTLNRFMKELLEKKK